MAGQSRRYFEALARFQVAAANDRAAEVAREKTRAALARAAVVAVKAGATRAELAKIRGLSEGYVGRLPGMPKKIVRDVDQS